MDETSPLTEPRPDQPNNAAENSHDAANGETKSAAPRNVSRTITSKRIVIPASAKRSAAAPSAPVAPSVVDKTQAPVETPRTNGDTPGVLYTPPPHDTAPVLPPEQLETSAPSVIPPSEASSKSDLDVASSKLEADKSPVILPPAASANAATQEIKPAPIAPKSNVAPATAAAAKKSSTQSASGGVKPAGMPYAPTPSNFSPLPVVETPRKGRSLAWLLWVGAALLLIVAAIAVVPLLFPNLLPGLLPLNVGTTPTGVAVVQPTLEATAQATTTQLPTGVATDAAAVPTNAPLIIPTPPVDGSQASILSDAALTGWFADDETTPNYGDENLYAGTYQGQNLSSILQFNLRNLPRDTKILFAAIELTGRDGSRLGSGGEWQLDLVENSLDKDWFGATTADISEAPSLVTIGAPLSGSELGAGRLTRFILSETERQMLEQQFQNGNAVFRLRGPDGTGDNLFSWESSTNGSPLNSPTLHIVFEPGAYVIVTNTPEPENVLTAAAYVVRGTDQAKRLGTPTRFPPGVATGTAGPGLIIVPVETGIPQNEETAVARAQLATAIARTTGTYTPTQPFVLLFPTNTPGVIVPERLATATPIPPDTDLLTIPIDYAICQCQGRILALSNKYGGERATAPIMMEPDGTEAGKLSGDLYYRLAVARETYSPDRKRRLIYPPNSNGVQQVGYEDLETHEIVTLTNFPKGITYDASWSPDGNYIAYVTTERGNTDEIWVYDLGTGENKPITDSSDMGQPWNKKPTWSPDSQQIAFWSSRAGNPQIWVMNRDGSNPINISNNTFTEIDPVWVK